MVKRFTDDPTLSWEERFRRLEHHHIEEVTELIARIDRISEELELCVAAEEQRSEAQARMNAALKEVLDDISSVGASFDRCRMMLDELVGEH